MPNLASISRRHLLQKRSEVRVAEALHQDPVLRFVRRTRYHSASFFLNATSHVSCVPPSWPFGAAEPGPRARVSIGQTLQGSFSAVLKPNFASKYAFESSRRDLHNALECTPLHLSLSSNFCLKIAEHFRKFQQNSSKFEKMLFYSCANE